MAKVNGTSVTTPVRFPLGRDSIAWRVNTEPVIIFGGGRALLLQVSHPSIAAGVEDHSSYKRDPWGRLFGTMHIVGKIMFGTPEESLRYQDTLMEFHKSIVGVGDDGTPYRALDPELLLWVWATLLDTAVDLYQRCVEPLTDAEIERYYQESKGLAVAVGVPAEMCPADWDALQSYFANVVKNDLRVTDGARAVATAVLAPPFPLGLDALVALPQKMVTTGLLPASLRAEYGLSWSRREQRRLDAFFRSLRVASKVTYAPIRRLPADLTVRMKKPLRLPVLQWAGGRIISRRLQRSGFTV